MSPDPRRPDVDRDGRRPVGLEHHPPAGSSASTGRLEALPRRRHGRWSSSASRCSAPSTRHTSLVRVGVFMASSALGLGATMQNLVLAVQNNTAQRDMGAASSVVAFFRSMGGSIGVSALGAVLSHQVAGSVADRPRQARRPAGRRAAASAIPDMATLPARGAAVFEPAFGDATGRIFLIAVPCAADRPDRGAVHPRGAAAPTTTQSAMRRGDDSPLNQPEPASTGGVRRGDSARACRGRPCPPAPKAPGSAGGGTRRRCPARSGRRPGRRRC